MRDRQTLFTLREERIFCFDAITSYERHIQAMKRRIATIDKELGSFNNKPKKGYITTLINSLLDDYRDEGIVSDDVINAAASEWLSVKRETVATVLSRMKAVGEVELINTRYVKVQRTDE